MRIVFFGTPELAVPTLERILAGPHEVVAVVSQPDRPRGRGRKVAPSPVSARAERAGVPILRPERSGGAKDPDLMEQLRELAPDMGVVVAFGQFLPKSLRELPSRGYLINAHASLLPKYRGAAPIARAILEGERVTGISIMRVEREMDAGPVAFVREIAIGDDETTGELEVRIGELAADAIAQGLDLIASDDIEFTEQDHSAATEAPKLSREDGRLDFREKGDRLLQRVRALAPSPGAFTTLAGEPLRIHAAENFPSAQAPPEAPGTVVLGDDPPLSIATADGYLAPLSLQRAGGRALPTDAFLRGRSIPAGSVLGDAEDSA